MNRWKKKIEVFKIEWKKNRNKLLKEKKKRERNKQRKKLWNGDGESLPFFISVIGWKSLNKISQSFEKG